MRIRKRFLSISAATPPSSDLHAGDHHQSLIRVQHQQQQLHPNKINPYPHEDDDTRLSKFSDRSHRPSSPSSAHETTQIGFQPSGTATHLNKTKEHLESEKKLKDIIKIDETCRKENFLCAEANSHDLVFKGWLERDMRIPIKKRRGSIGKKMNHDFQEDNDITEEIILEQKAKKNKNDEKKGNTIMEGSRCSRVNGRGWRCGQQTLVGYSLCEHHLCKGRLRSMTTNVRGRALKEQEAKKKKDKEVEIPSLENHEIEDNEGEDEFKDWEMESGSSFIGGTKKFGKKKKKKKVGVVKARSLSSLLSQIDS